MKKSIVLLAAALSVAACVSPYQDALKTSLAQCTGGDQTACHNATMLQAQDAAWHAEQNRHAANVLAGIALGAAVGAAAYSASRPTYVYTPVYTPSYSHSMNCTSMSMGGGMVSTNCN